MDQNTRTHIQTIEAIQQKIAASLGIKDQPDEKQRELIDKATEILLQKIFLHTLDQLSEEDKKTYLDLIEKESTPRDLEKFLTEKIPTHSDNSKQIIDEFIEAMKTAGQREE